LINLLGRVDKGLLNVGGRLGGRLKENEAVVLGELGAFLVADLATVREVALVADEHDDEVGVTRLARLLQPPREVVERVTAGDVVDEQRARGAAIEATGDGAERLLAGCVPDLKLDGVAVDRVEAGAELDADGEVVQGLEALVGELQEQARLADACVADDDVLEEVLKKGGAEGREGRAVSGKTTERGNARDRAVDRKQGAQTAGVGHAGREAGRCVRADAPSLVSSAGRNRRRTR